MRYGIVPVGVKLEFDLLQWLCDLFLDVGLNEGGTA